MDACKIDALDQWCLHILTGIKWYQFVWKDDVRRLTMQPKLTAIIQSRWLTLFGHITRMDDNADAKRILLWRYAIVSCTLETTTTILRRSAGGVLISLS